MVGGRDDIAAKKTLFQEHILVRVILKTQHVKWCFKTASIGFDPNSV